MVEPVTVQVNSRHSVRPAASRHARRRMSARSASETCETQRTDSSNVRGTSTFTG